MTRIACLFVLISIVAVTLLATNPTGRTAIIFSFVGMPALVVGMAIYGIQRWREGAFWDNDSSAEKEPS